MLDYLPIEKAVKCYSRLFVPLARLIPEGELDAFSLKCLGETLEIPQGYLVNLKGYLEPCLEGVYQEVYPGCERFTFVDYYYALALNLEDLRAMCGPKRASEFHEGRRVAKMWSRNYEGKGIDALAAFYAAAVLSSPLFEAGCKLRSNEDYLHPGAQAWDAAVKELREMGDPKWS